MYVLKLRLAFYSTFSSTTHIPALSLPSCLIIPAFCIAAKSRSMVRLFTDNVSDICLLVMYGFDLMVYIIIC